MSSKRDISKMEKVLMKDYLRGDNAVSNVVAMLMIYIKKDHAVNIMAMWNTIYEKWAFDLKFDRDDFWDIFSYVLLDATIRTSPFRQLEESVRDDSKPLLVTIAETFGFNELSGSGKYETWACPNEKCEKPMLINVSVVGVRRNKRWEMPMDVKAICDGCGHAWLEVTIDSAWEEERGQGKDLGPDEYDQYRGKIIGQTMNLFCEGHRPKKPTEVDRRWMLESNTDRIWHDAFNGPAVEPASEPSEDATEAVPEERVDGGGDGSASRVDIADGNGDSNDDDSNRGNTTEVAAVSSSSNINDDVSNKSVIDGAIGTNIENTANDDNGNSSIKRSNSSGPTVNSSTTNIGTANARRGNTNTTRARGYGTNHTNNDGGNVRNGRNVRVKKQPSLLSCLWKW